MDNLEEEQIGITEEIAGIRKKTERQVTSSQRLQKKKLLEETAKVNNVFCKFKTHSITKTNELFYAGTVVVTNRLGVKIIKVAARKKSVWRRRLQNKIEELRKHISQLNYQRIRKLVM